MSSSILTVHEWEQDQDLYKDRIDIDSDQAGANGVFHKCFTEFAEFSEKKIFVITVKGLEPATSYVRDQDVTTIDASKTHVRDSIFKVRPIQASGTYQIP